MANSTYFIQGCPACGRRLQIRVEYLAKTVVCQHCRRQFTACDPNSRRYDDQLSVDPLIRRADELLQNASHYSSRVRNLRPR
jgi:hypothetical protein